jgi:hypothetical protein
MHESRKDRANALRRKSGYGRWWLFLVVGACALASPAAADMILISELYYDAVGSDNGFSFVELSGVAGTSLDGLTLEGVNGSNGAIGPVVSLSGVFPADGLFVVADDDGGGTSVSGADLLVNFDFQNGPDSVQLMDADIVLDAVGYGVFSGSEIFAGEGSPAPDGPAGSSLARLFADQDTDDNLADFEVLSVPTPGSADFLPVPEPHSGLLTASGLLMLRTMARREIRRNR